MLLLAVAVVAVSIGALQNANQYWASAARSCLVLLVAFAILASIVSRRAKAFAIGFAVFAVCRIIAWLFFPPSFGPLLSDALIARLHSAIADRHDEQVIQTLPNGVTRRSTRRTVDPPVEHFTSIAQCQITLLIGALGGLLAVWAQRERRGIGAKVEGNAMDYT
jgi:hypothetical protein